MFEEWREIPGFPGYEVSTLGRIRSYYHNRWGLVNEPHILRGSIGRGYRSVGVTESSGKQRKLRNHVAVALAFHGPRPDGMEVRHLDGDSLNNLLTNLVYGTPSENQTDRIRHGTHHKVKLTAEQVLEIRALRERPTTLAQLADQFGVSVANIGAICTRQTWRHL